MVLEDLQKWQDKLTTGTELALKFHREQGKRLPENPKKIAYFGMGGSGIAGKILKTYFGMQEGIDAEVYHSPTVPPSINNECLAFVTTYSGNTWETVVALKELIARGVPTLVVTHGGRALQLAKEYDLMCVEMPEAVSPRGALGYFLGFFLTLLDEMKLIDGKSKISQYVQHCEDQIATFIRPDYFEPFIQSVGKRDFFHIWGVAGESDAFAYRAQTQFNENSKVQSIYTEFPELCHNLVVGFTNYAQPPMVLWLHTGFISDYLKRAVKATELLLGENGVGLYKPAILGDTFDKQLFNIILWSDFASYFLGKARGVEVNPVKLIDSLKKKHQEQGIQI